MAPKKFFSPRLKQLKGYNTIEMETGTQINVEYFFRLLYECLRGACYGRADGAELAALLAQIWLWIIVIGYILSIVALFIIAYATMRLFDLRKREEKYYQTLITVPGAKGEEHPRWKHIKELADGTAASGWREAIIEADILLDELLTRLGYPGANIGDKLKSADALTFTTLQDAWEAHKVRNQIAHEGSAFALSEALVRRTIGRYEAIFHEFKVI